MEWMPITFYEISGTERLVHAKKKKNGLIVFKTTTLTRTYDCSYVTRGKGFLDISIQFDKLLKGE